MQRRRRWFLEPLNGQTNEVFARELDEEESAQEIRGIGRREAFFVWEVSERKKDFFVASRTMGLSFKIWGCFEGFPPREVPFDERKQREIGRMRRRAKALREGKPSRVA